MDGTLTKDALIEMIRDKVGYPVKEAKEILEIILEEVKLKLEEGKEVKISGFGKWTVKEKRSRPGRNPHTGGRQPKDRHGPSARRACRKERRAGDERRECRSMLARGHAHGHLR